MTIDHQPMAGLAGTTTDALDAVPDLELFHFGMVVDDLEAAKALWGTVLGLTWTSTSEFRDMRVVVDGERESAGIDATYSTTGPIHAELIADRGIGNGAGPWARHQLNHVGFYAPNVREASAALERHGMELVLELEGPDGSTEPRCAYHRTGSGLWLELVPVTFADRLAEWIGTPGTAS